MQRLVILAVLSVIVMVLAANIFGQYDCEVEFDGGSRTDACCDSSTQWSNTACQPGSASVPPCGCCVVGSATVTIGSGATGSVEFWVDDTMVGSTTLGPGTYTLTVDVCLIVCPEYGQRVLTFKVSVKCRESSCDIYQHSCVCEGCP